MDGSALPPAGRETLRACARCVVLVPVAKMIEHIALIGYGLLGSAIADRLAGSGHRVAVYDRDPDRLRAADAAGLRCAASAPGAAAQADAVVMAVMTTDDVEAIVADLGGHGLRGKLVIDCTTGDPDRMAALGAELDASGAAYVEAMVAGSSAQVRSGEAQVLVGGPDAHVERAAVILACIAGRVSHIGGWGQASRMKLVFNLVLGLNRAVLAEGLGLARACGIDPGVALKVLSEGAAHSRVMQTKGPKMISGDFAPQARLRQHLKDVDLILSLAAACAASTPLSAEHRHLLDRLVRDGHGDLDNSAILLAFTGEIPLGACLDPDAST